MCLNLKYSSLQTGYRILSGLYMECMFSYKIDNRLSKKRKKEDGYFKPKNKNKKRDI